MGSKYCSRQGRATSNRTARLQQWTSSRPAASMWTTSLACLLRSQFRGADSLCRHSAKAPVVARPFPVVRCHTRNSTTTTAACRRQTDEQSGSQQTARGQQVSAASIIRPPVVYTLRSQHGLEQRPYPALATHVTRNFAPSFAPSPGSAPIAFAKAV